jgi:pyruvate/2-oxoglutarate dehydrogenase complex dihydrolipoamide dehydrogenase (E3) component
LHQFKTNVAAAEHHEMVRRFGSRVSVVEAAPQLAAREDDDVAAELLERMREDGVEVHLGANVSRVEGRSGKAVRLHLQTAAADRIIEGSDILVAVSTPHI